MSKKIARLTAIPGAPGPSRRRRRVKAFVALAAVRDLRRTLIIPIGVAVLLGWILFTQAMVRE